MFNHDQPYTSNLAWLTWIATKTTQIIPNLPTYQTSPVDHNRMIMDKNQENTNPYPLGFLNKEIDLSSIEAKTLNIPMSLNTKFKPHGEQVGMIKANQVDGNVLGRSEDMGFLQKCFLFVFVYSINIYEEYNGLELQRGRE